MSMKNCSKHIQEKKLDAKQKQSSSKINVVVSVENFVQKSNPFRRRVFVVGDFPLLCGSNASSLKKVEDAMQKRVQVKEKSKENLMVNKSSKRTILDLYGVIIVKEQD